MEKNKKINFDEIGVVILAAGRGTRMKSTTSNKVVSLIHKKPLILRSYENLIHQGLVNIYIVVGFAKDSVVRVLGNRVSYIHQHEQKGTAHAVATSLHEISQDIKILVVIGGDDSAFYNDNILLKFLEAQNKRGYKMSVMTTQVDNPNGLGRIVRDLQNNHYVQEIVEEKNASEEQKKIKEINTGAYIFDREFLEKNIKRINKNKISGEYYLPDMLQIAVSLGEPVFAFLIPNKYFHGVNTPEELKEAEMYI